MSLENLRICVRPPAALLRKLDNVSQHKSAFCPACEVGYLSGLRTYLKETCRWRKIRSRAVKGCQASVGSTLSAVQWAAGKKPSSNDTISVVPQLIGPRVRQVCLRNPTMAETVGLAIGSPALPTSLLYGLGTPAGNRESENYIREFESLVRDQKRVLYDTLEAFFGGKMPRTKLRELLSDPLSPGWRSQDMEIALRHSLGNSGNSIFLDLISQLFQTIKSLEHSLRKITDGSRATHIDPGSGVRLVAAVEGRKNKAEDFRRTHKYVEDLEIQDESFQSFVQAAVASTDLIGKQAIENLVASLAVLREIDRVASAVEDLATGEVAENQGTAGDSESTYSVKSEVSHGGSSGLASADATSTGSHWRSESELPASIDDSGD